MQDLYGADILRAKILKSVCSVTLHCFTDSSMSEIMVILKNTFLKSSPTFPNPIPYSWESHSYRYALMSCTVMLHNQAIRIGLTWTQVFAHMACWIGATLKTHFYRLRFRSCNRISPQLRGWLPLQNWGTMIRPSKSPVCKISAEPRKSSM